MQALETCSSTFDVCFCFLIYCAVKTRAIMKKETRKPYDGGGVGGGGGGGGGDRRVENAGRVARASSR